MSDNYITENQLQVIERMMMRHTWQDVTTLDNEALTAMIGAIRGLRATLVAQQQRAEAAEAHAVTWIDVTERLPEPDRRVLAVYREDYKTVIIRAVHLPAKYAACYEEYEEAEYDEETDTLYFPGGWYEAMESAEYAYIGPVSGTVTHWKEMPTLPSRA